MGNVRYGLVVSFGVTGCLFPSFDGMQGGDKPNDVRAEAEPTEAIAAATAPDAGASTSTGTSTSTTSTGDAGADVATTSPGAGKIACGTETCPVAANSHCCADYVNPQFYCSSPSHTIGWCTGGGGRALFCDEKADCPGAQVCCEKNDVASCAATCDGGKVLP